MIQMKQVTYAVLMAFVIALALAVVLSSTGEVSEKCKKQK